MDNKMHLAIVVAEWIADKKVLTDETWRESTHDCNTTCFNSIPQSIVGIFIKIMHI